MTPSRFLVIAAFVIMNVRVIASEQILNGHTFTLPDGFEIEVAAKSPLVERPITAMLDSIRRLGTLNGAQLDALARVRAGVLTSSA